MEVAEQYDNFSAEDGKGAANVIDLGFRQLQ